MLKFLIIFKALLISTGISSAHNKVGNGGGGTRTPSGEYILLNTIKNEDKYSGRETDIENCRSQIFSDMIADIKKMQSFLPTEVGLFLLNHVCRGAFYRNRAAFPNADQTASINHLKKIYSLATGLKKQDIIIYAITTANYRKTYFMPEFYQLTYLKQKIILFHELFWLYFNSGNNFNFAQKEEVALYKKMLALEHTLIEYLANTDDFQNQHKLKTALADFKNF